MNNYRMRDLSIMLLLFSLGVDFALLVSDYILNNTIICVGFYGTCIGILGTYYFSCKIADGR